MTWTFLTPPTTTRYAAEDMQRVLPRPCLCQTRNGTRGLTCVMEALSQLSCMPNGGGF